MKDDYKEPFFSIILPVYNVEAYLDRCVQSILSQDFNDYEIIMVDDGSTDSSPVLCDLYQETYKNVRVIHKANGGLAIARNTGIDLAHGKYISFIDSDDWVDYDMYGEIFKLIEENNKPDIIKYGYIRHYLDEKPRKYSTNAIPGYYYRIQMEKYIFQEMIGPEYFSATLERAFILSACMHVYDKTLIEKNNLRFVSERKVGSEDWLFNIQVYLCANSLAATDNCWYHYDTREGSLTQRHVAKFYERRKCLFLYMKEEIHNKGFEEALAKRMSVFYLRMVYYDCITNECRRDVNKKAAIKSIKGYLNDPLFQETRTIFSG
jgi:glycosyltransferase involved in cell wall biosynthesis